MNTAGSDAIIRLMLDLSFNPRLLLAPSAAHARSLPDSEPDPRPLPPYGDRSTAAPSSVRFPIL